MEVEPGAVVALAARTAGLVRTAGVVRIAAAGARLVRVAGGLLAAAGSGAGWSSSSG